MTTPAVTINTWGDAIFLAVTNALNLFLAAIPLVIGALVILVIGWILSGLLGSLTRRIVAAAGADRVYAQRAADVYGQSATRWQPSKVAGDVVKWLVRLVFLIAAANALGLTQVSQLLNQVILWIPNLVVAAIVLLVAPLIARFLRGAIEVGAGQMGFTNGPLLGRLAEIAIVAFAVIIAINQIGIAANLVNTLFIGLVGALALAFGIAFGLGGRDVAAQITQDWYASSQQAAGRIQDALADEQVGSSAKAPTSRREAEPKGQPAS